jgi:4-hydroxy-tetrahydrodipicolinate synthase
MLHDQFRNVKAVKEASGSVENMRRTRECCGELFYILSGDDDKTFEMMTDPKIHACGVISVVSNVAPGAVQRMTQAILSGGIEQGRTLAEALKPLFGIVTVKTQEDSPYGPRLCKARNPLPIKTLMALLGMPVGQCRQPLGKMTKQGIQVVLEAARTVWKKNPEILEPVGRAFEVNIEERLNDRRCLEGLYYAD